MGARFVIFPHFFMFLTLFLRNTSFFGHPLFVAMLLDITLPANASSSVLNLRAATENNLSVHQLVQPGNWKPTSLDAGDAGSKNHEH